MSAQQVIIVKMHSRCMSAPPQVVTHSLLSKNPQQGALFSRVTVPVTLRTTNSTPESFSGGPWTFFGVLARRGLVVKKRDRPSSKLGRPPGEVAKKGEEPWQYLAGCCAFLLAG